MFLAIDCGNTNTVFAIFKKDGSHVSWRCSTNSKRTTDEYASWLMPLFKNEKIEFDTVENALISSVVPDVNFNLETLCQRYFSIKPAFIKSPKVQLDIKVDVDKPEEVGADRLVNAIAAKARYQTPCVIVDFGTATTFDVIDSNGVYCGGVIAPGINLSLDALQNAAAALPKVSIKKPDHVIAKNTITAMQSGLYWGYVAMIEGVLSRIIDELEAKPTIIATGGLASIIASGTNIIDKIDSDLTLDGLRSIQLSNMNANQLKSVA